MMLRSVTHVIVIVALTVLHVHCARRLVAVGDLHGDLNQTLAVLRLTNLIDNHKHWIGEDTILVQVGDVLDVGPQDIDVVRLLMKLTEEAAKSGGCVEQLLGNHELRNLEGDYSAANPDSLLSNGGIEGRKHLLSMNDPVGRYLRTRNAIFHHGQYLFMHGGFSTSTVSMITDMKHVETFNSELRRALVTGAVVTSPLAREGLNLIEIDDVPVINPILVRSIINVKCDDLKKALKKHFPTIKTVVVGHVPHDADDFEDWRLCGGALIDIDFGMSTWKRGVSGSVAALQIVEQNNTVELLSSTVKLPQWLPDVHPIDLLLTKQVDLGLIRLPIAFLLCIVFACAVAFSLTRSWVGRRSGATSTSREQNYGTF